MLLDARAEERVVLRLGCDLAHLRMILLFFRNYTIFFNIKSIIA